MKARKKRATTTAAVKPLPMAKMTELKPMRVPMAMASAAHEPMAMGFTDKKRRRRTRAS